MASKPPHPRPLSASGHLMVVFVSIAFVLAVLLNLQSLGRRAPGDGDLQVDWGLQTSADKPLRIAIFSDLHFGEEEHGWGIEQDINSLRVMRSVLDDERPALVVLNGDLITGENTFRENSSAYVHQIVAPMVERRIPWASTYGNHDSDFNLSRESILKEEQKHELSLTHLVDAGLSGVTNYWLTVRDETGDGLAILWFLDSRGGMRYQHPPGDGDFYEDWVAPETAEWFLAMNARLQVVHGRALPSLLFTHIPPHVYRQRQGAGIDPRRYPGLNDDNPLDYQGGGSDDDAFVRSLRAAGNIHSMYTGHDHGDSWCSLWPESSPGGGMPFICFAKHTGYGGYGSWNRGARIIELGFAGGELDVRTWVRMENGVAVTSVALNATYGLDEYPADTGEES